MAPSSKSGIKAITAKGKKLMGRKEKETEAGAVETTSPVESAGLIDGGVVGSVGGEQTESTHIVQPAPASVGTTLPLQVHQDQAGPTPNDGGASNDALIFPQEPPREQRDANASLSQLTCKTTEADNSGCKPKEYISKLEGLILERDSRIMAVKQTLAIAEVNLSQQRAEAESQLLQARRHAAQLEKSTQQQQRELVAHNLQITELQKTRKDLLEAVNQRDQKIEVMHAELDELTVRLADVVVQKQYYLDDSNLQNRWAILDSKIETLVSRRYPKDITHRHASEIFKYVVSRPETLLKSPQLRRILFQAFIWNELLYWVFGPKGYLWAGKLDGAFTEMRFHLESHVSAKKIEKGAYEAWKAQTASLLAQITGTDREAIRSIAVEIRKRLQGFEHPTFTHTSPSPSYDEIVADAVELDGDMCQCRAAYSIFGPDDVDDASSPVKLENSTQLIRFRTAQGSGRDFPKSGTSIIISPGIVKEGNSQGDRYHERSIIAPRKVACFDS